MASQKQIERIKYLRSNGLSQKDIAEDVGLSPQMVSVVLKKLAEEFVEHKPVKIIVAKGFEPKDTVIEFNTMDFENFREAETLYGTMTSIYEMRSGVVHKTSFPECCLVKFYPMVADLLPLYELPEKLFEKSVLHADFVDKTTNDMALRPNQNYRTAHNFIREWYVKPTGIMPQQSEYENVIFPLAKLVSELLSKQLDDLNQSFLQMMPDENDSGDTIRYHMENQMLPEMMESGRGGTQFRYSEFEKNYLQSMADKYPFLISWIYQRHQNMEQVKLDIEGHFQDLFFEAISSVFLKSEDLKYVFEFGTVDKETIEKYQQTGARTPEQLEAIQEHGVANLDELEAAKIAFNDEPIKLKDYKWFSKETGRLSDKVRRAVERKEIDDALIHAFVRFEKKAIEIWNQGNVRKGQRNVRNPLSNLPTKWKDADDLIERIVQSNLSYNQHLNHILESENYKPSTEERNLLAGKFRNEKGRPLPDASILRGNQVPPGHHVLYCRNLIRVKIQPHIDNIGRNKVTDPTAEVLISILAPCLSEDGELHKFCEEARIIRNKLMHDDQMPSNLVTRHVRAILELTELVIATSERLEKLG
jgi:predicted transcriptional regulator